ncbi:MAG: RNA methyltransferase [Bacteroidales bacterium]|nr:RNA methyltransferase [Bacteroidales bacterium]
MPTNSDLIQHLEQFATEKRRELFYKLIGYRTRYVTVVLEDIYQSQNASAVLRTCDCLGIQDVHIIENQNKYQINPDVALGANKWLSIKKYNQKNHNNTLTAIKALKDNGYRIVATTPHTNNTELPDFNLQPGKTAMLFGTEKKGLSPTALSLSDEFVKIPLYGFTESYNISVSAAIILYQLTEKLKTTSPKIEWQLSTAEQAEILLEWFSASIRNSKGIINKYLTEINGRPQ